jgi:Protein of unknown function (DUF2971)
VANLKEVLALNEVDWTLANIFNASSLAKVAQALDAKTRFVHYTNADTAMKLLSNKEVWLRKSTQMNDFMEVEHGFNCLAAAYRKHKPDFEGKLEEAFPGICQRIEDYFDGWLPTYRNGTFIACVSEHDDSPERNEDRMGRLSMWRAYGGVSGVAIVMNGDVFHTPVASDTLKAYTSPVAYLDVNGFDAKFIELIQGIIKNIDLMKAMGVENFFACITHAFRYATLCTKHPGFFEEREWRIIYSPAIEKSDIITENIESVNGIPQRVCKLPLNDVPHLGINGIELPKLINRIIVGPTLHPFEVSEALVLLLEKAGVQDAASKVFISDIPLRQVG